MADTPTPPRNVRALMAGGHEIPLECVYHGFVDGVHEWVAVLELGELPSRILMDVLPAHSSVSVDIGGAGG